MNNIKNNIRKDFTIVPNKLIEDNYLSDRARFLFIYMASKPNDWTFYNNELSKSLKYTIATLRKYIEELCSSGWIIKEPQNRHNGLFTANTYIMNSSPIEEPCYNFYDTEKNRHGEKPTRKKTVTKKNRNGKNTTLNNKYLNQKEKEQKSTLNKRTKILK